MMKVTLIRQDRNNLKHMRTLAIDNLIERIKYDTKQQTIDELRRFIGMDSCEQHDQFWNMHRLPRIYPAAELGKNRDGGYSMKRFNGIVLLDVNHLTKKEEVQLVKQRAGCLPTTMAAFTGASGRSVKILIPAVRPNGRLPQNEDEAADFYQRAYCLAANLYDSILPHPVTRRKTGCCLLNAESSAPDAYSCRMTLDAEPYFNAEAKPFIVPDYLEGGETSENFNNQETEGNDSDDKPETTKDRRQTTREEAWEEHVSRSTRQLISFLSNRYEFRFNTIMGYTEYRPKQSYTAFKPVDERTRNSLAIEARLDGQDVWDKDINRFVTSDRVRSYNPVQEYLWRVHDKWDGRDHIRALAQTVPNDNPHWADWFYTWFLGMVAQWMGRSRCYGNSTAPLLISRQGYNKSTFCKSLIPDELQWGYNDSLVLDEKKAVLQAMSQFLLINLDEFNAISPKTQEGFLKNIIQLANVKVKRPYGKHVEVFPRLASFIATANMTDILTDASGCRRFIGIELTGPIRMSSHVNHQQLYAQAFHAISNGETYWFDADQTALIMKSNQQFRMRQPIEQFFYDCFEPAANESEGEYLTATTIFMQVRKMAGSTILNTNLRAFGRWLMNLNGLHHKASNRGTLYLVRRRQ